MLAWLPALGVCAPGNRGEEQSAQSNRGRCEAHSGEFWVSEVGGGREERRPLGLALASKKSDTHQLPATTSNAMTVRISLPRTASSPASLPEYVRTNSAASVASDLAAVAKAIARARRIVVVSGLSTYHLL